jgi:60 kDa SS-A/Ro ribonucleoprotein
MSNALKEYLDGVNSTPQTERLNERQIKNNAGGYGFRDVERLTRFLVLGTDGGTFYVQQKELTKQNVEFVVDMIKRDERLVLDTVVDVSVNARAPKNNTALFVLALVFTAGQDKAAATDALLKVARTATHLFEFVGYLKAMGGLGRAKRKAIAAWYLNKSRDAVAMQVIKYRNRNGFTHKDLFSLSHVKGFDKSVGNFVMGKGYDGGVPVIDNFIKAQGVTNVRDAVEILDSSNLPWEAFPTAMHNEAEFWRALFNRGDMGQMALLRNVKRFHNLGLFNDLKFAGDVAKALADQVLVEKGRLHPMNYLNAYFTCKPFGVNAKVMGALEKGYYAAFKNVEPSGKRVMLSLDVSGSMTWGFTTGLNMTARDASAAFAQILVRTEDYIEVNAFTTRLMPLSISESDSITEVIHKVSNLPFGGTDVAQPIVQALRAKQMVDAFIVVTDSETWGGSQHVTQALSQYRKTVNPDAKLIVVGMTATEITVIDPQDAGSLGVVGFDSVAPKLITDFISGRI